MHGQFKRFCKNKQPDKKYCYHFLKDGHIYDDDYLHALKDWDAFKMENMGDYHDHYLKRYVFLIADIFEKLTSKSPKFYKIHPSHYFSSAK